MVMIYFSYGFNMPALYVEKIPDELYRALRKRARDNRKSIAAEVISLLERNVPTAKELQRRREFYKRMAELRARQPESPGPFPTVEEMIREDRDR
jgi:plasmid stability protein